MKEQLLHYIWQWRKLPLNGLQLTSGEAIRIQAPGIPNRFSGPDFLNAQIEIGSTTWVGHVELHLKSSLWYAHEHQGDPNYQNVILHVVWEHDKEVITANKVPLPTLQIRDYISQSRLTDLKEIQSELHTPFLICEKELRSLPAKLKTSWLAESYHKRLIHKSSEIALLLRQTHNNWEQVFFIFLMRNFGLNINAMAFQTLAMKLDFAVFQKIRPYKNLLECLFLGMAGLLHGEGVPDTYTSRMITEFQYLRYKFSLNTEGIPKPEFCRLRPANFPTIRLSQLAVLLNKHPRLFTSAMNSFSRAELHKLLSVTASPYWDTHYSLGKSSAKSPKKLSATFIDLLIINTLIPFQYQYAKAQGSDNRILLEKLLESCPPERNRIINHFRDYGIRANNALESQALIQLYENHCRKHRCLECRFGRYLLKGI